MDVYETIIARNLSGGSGGGLDYIVPEQTITVVYDETLQKYIAVVENVNVRGMYDGQSLFTKLTTGLGDMFLPTTFTENTIVISAPGENMIIKKESGDSGRWYIEYPADALGVESPIAVIKGF